ncbi:hypothetical protein COU15_00450 [Candidatus Kaiserbacteria bacterium CG10_big_fil_rev_8_21_14_0_10_45_20]|uniref:AcrB/AcrD/AcrF family protein n=1 Tax=Candidatus Kaiserbacteria bacterium CG10_big_fil_rev_8_21_14_0_10_45_20 TaxID=1974607 RepID=A0A2H0UGM5_9BACT|nr:MAG: hypothetical protein COU15_00450 [Candidatus Kaiserbacteria bacterium CG10_big_fil_rev_8_21_14_0_10_45_20]
MLFLWNFLLEKRRFAAIVLIAIILFGLGSLFSIKKESSPEVTIPIGIVSTGFPGASAEEVETLVTNKLERRISSNVDNINKLSSSSSEGFSVITVEFSANADLDKSLRQLRDEVDIVRTELPEEANDPSVSEVDFVNQPIVTIVISGDVPSEELIALAKPIQEEIERVSGVGNVSIGGFREREVAVVVNQEALSSYNLSLNDIASGIRAQNASLPAGSITVDEISYSLRIEGDFSENESFGDIPIVTTNGVVYLRDLGAVIDGLEKTDSISRASLNGNPSLPALSFSVFKRSGADVTEVSSAVRNRVESLKNEPLLNGLEAIVLYDLGEQIEDDLNTLGTSGLMTVLLVAIVLFITLGWREALLASVAIPLSFFAGFIGLENSGNTLNFISLFALILAVGILVDSAIVIVEGIHNNLKKHPDGDKIEAAKKALVEYHWPISSGTMTTIAVFAPLFLVSGIVGEFISSIPFTIIFILIASLFVALGVLPMLAVSFLRRRTTSALELKQEALTHTLQVWYRNILESLLGNKKKENRFFALILLLFVITLSFPFVGIVKVIFFANDDSEYIFIDAELPQGSILENTDLEMRRIEETLYANKDIESFVTTAGGASPFSSGASGQKFGNIQITLKDTRVKKSIDIVEDLRQQFAEIGKAKITLFQEGGGPPVGDPVLITVQGDNLSEITLVAEDVLSVLESIEGTANVSTTARESAPEVVFTIKRAEAAEVGMTPSMIASAVRTAISGVTATKVVGTDADIDVVVKAGLNSSFTDQHDTNKISIDEIRNFSLLSPQGPILLASVVDVSIREGKTTIRHEDESRIMTVSAGITKDGNVFDIQKAFELKRDEIAIPDGVTVTFGGENDETNQSFADMGTSLLIGLVAMFTILILQFNSYRLALYVISIVPFSLIGIMAGLALTGKDLSFSSVMGFIALTGIVVNNSIILIDVINRYRKDGMSVREAVIEGSVSRIRPILLTTITTVIGVIPLIFTSALWSPLAYAIMFGLAFSIVITLLLIPVVYSRWPGKI